MQGFFKAWRILKSTVLQFRSVHGPFLASGLAFDLLLSCIPLLFIILSVMGFLLAGSDRAIENAVNVLVPLIPNARTLIADNLSIIVEARSRFGLIGFGLFFIFSTTMFGSARTALNTIYGIKQPRHFLIGMGVDLLMTLAFSALFGLTIAILSLLAVVHGLTDEMGVEQQGPRFSVHGGAVLPALSF